LIVVAAMVAGFLNLTSGASFAVQFCNTAPIPGTGGTGPSGLYPSPIVVSGLSGTVTDVNVSLIRIRTRGDNNSPPQHWVEDIDVMVSAPTPSKNVTLMSDAGGDNDISQGPVVDVNLTFDDQAANQLPADVKFASGTYRPVDDDDDMGEAQPVDVWDAPAPTPTESTSLSTFNGIDPNGTWNLWVVDDTNQAATDINGGWCVDILTTGGGGGTTSTSTSTTLGPTTSTSTSTSTTLAPTTSTSTSTSTTLAPTTSTSTSTSTTLAPTTSTSTSTSTTLAPTTSTSTSTSTTSTTSASTTTTSTTSTSTSTTVAPTSTSTSTTISPTSSTSTTISANLCVAQLQDRRARVNRQVNDTRAVILQSGAPAEQVAAYLATLEASRARANDQIARAIAACPA
jgi:hypothetical protein